jgi:trehalose 6-phosphate synthase
VLLLSGATGAYPQLAKGVLPVAAADVQGTMEAMYQALTMSDEERERRSTILTESIEREDITHWFQRQFEDINALAK